MSIETIAGPLRAAVVGDQVQLQMTPPKDWRMNHVLDIRGRRFTCHFVNSGVPHAVILLDDLDGCDVQGLGSDVRHHPDFAPSGTNANFIRVASSHALRIRTYERGVEAETLACGTGMVAAALVAARAGLVTPPVQLTPASGDVLTVDFRMTSDSAEEVTLLGPAVHVFQGHLTY